MSASAVPTSAGSALLPVLGLLFNAFTWGISWWPFRQLQAQGLHPLWATALIYLLAVLCISLWRPASWAQLLRAPALWVLVLASGTTNAAFNWGVTIGDVVRVVLLFYLMPLWAVLLARLLLRERLSPLAMFLGGAVVAGGLAALLGTQGLVPAPPPPAWPWLLGALALGALFLASNLTLQYGAARLSANITAVVMVSEVLFASVSAVALGAGTVSLPLLLGGALIVGAALLSVAEPG